MLKNQGVVYSVLSRSAAEEGDPAKLGEVRDHGAGQGLRGHPLISPLRVATGSLLLPQKEREKTFGGSFDSVPCIPYMRRSTGL